MYQKEDDYAGIERALQEGWTLKVYSMGGAGFATLTSSDGDKIKVESYNNFYVSEILRQVSGKFLGRESDEQESKKESPLDEWIRHGNELFGRRDEEGIRLAIMRGNQSLIPAIPQPTFTQAYDMLAKIEYSPKLSDYLNFIDQVRKISRVIE